MCKKMIYLLSFVLVPAMFGVASGSEGLKGEYYHTSGQGPPNNPWQTLILTRIDPTVNFDWGTEGPDPSMNVDDFAVRWIGMVEAPTSETYTFHTQTDDGIRLWVDNRLIIDNWTEHGNTHDSGNITLTAGQKYEIKLEWYENGGNARCELSWSTATISREAIPSQYLQPERPYARNPIPADGATYPDTWLSLQWEAGDFAVSHNVYFGDNFDDVTAGTGGTSYGNQTDTYFIVGFLGNPYPEGLVPGTTYYWRIDEVDPTNTYEGRVWSFLVPFKKTYNPIPPDGAEDVSAEPVLSWSAGLGGILYTPYFGESFDIVNNAVGGTSQRGTTFTPPGPLEVGTTYYWRVDVAGIYGMTKGDVWSFTTIAGGTGRILHEWWLNISGTTISNLTSNSRYPNNPDGKEFLTSFDGPVNWADNYGSRISGWLYVPISGDYTFWVAGDDNCDLYLSTDVDPANKVLIAQVPGWTPHLDWDNDGGGVGGDEQKSSPITLQAGQKYYIEGLMKEGGGGDSLAAAWQGPASPVRTVISGDYLCVTPYDPVRAYAPSPVDDSTDVKPEPTLRWSDGRYAASHQVYFGTNEDAVRNATTASPEYKGTKALGSESYEPGKLAWATTYYWRIDEVNSVNPDSPWIGSVWSFTTTDFLVIDDFETYDAGENQIWYAWRDGLGFGAIGTPPYSPGNGTGSAVGDETTASYTEETIVNNGDQSMPYWYDNNKPDKAKYSEAKLTLSDKRNWAEEGVKALSLWFQGYPASVGSFTESPAGTYTMTGSGADIWNLGPGAGQYHDEFHFAYKTLTGPGTIIARVDSVQNTNGWAKAGVMIRETLDPNSAHAFACITPSNGVAAQGRPSRGGASFNTNQTGIAAPHWVRLERDLAGNFTVSHSANGTTWEPVTNATPQNIPMSSIVYVGLALTAHNAAATCEAVFSNVTISGNVSAQWIHQDIGILSNDPEPMYVALANRTGTPAVVYHDNPNAAQINTWTEWNIDLKEFADKGVVLTDVNSIAIGFGNRNNPQAGGSGKMYFDDIRLYQSRYVPGKGTPLAADFDNDGIVYNSDLEILSNNWLNAAAAPSGSPVGWWKFENNTNDSAGAHHGTANGSPVYAAGVDGQAISLDGINDYVSVGSIGISGAAPRTISGWAKADTTNIPSWTTAFGFSNDLTANQAGTYFDIQRRNYSSYCIHVYGWERDMMDIDLDWHHLAATYDGTTINWYGDGMLYGSEDRTLDTLDNVMMGKRGDRENYFPGSVDDVRIYGYALSSSEIFYLAGGSPVDLNDDMKIDFKDYALLVEQWLEQQLWPEW